MWKPVYQNRRNETMAAEHDPPKPAPADQRRDNFQKIVGIGVKSERRSHDAGILTYQDLAARSPEQLAEVTGVSAGRIASDDWTGQARRLARSPDTLPSEPSQHYASFHIEFLLKVDDSVRRTKVHHHQSETDFSWAGWDEDRLIALLREHIPWTASGQPTEATDPQPSAQLAASQSETAPSGIQPETVKPPIGPSPSDLRIEEFNPIREGERTYNWGQSEPISVRLTLRVNRAKRLSDATLDFRAEIKAHSTLGDSRRWPISTMQGAIRPGQPLFIESTGLPLPRGLYRLEAAVLIYPADHTSDAPSLYSRHISGALIQVADDALASKTPGTGFTPARA
jgi:hypothetical protein